MSQILDCEFIKLESLDKTEWIEFLEKVNDPPFFSKVSMLRAVEALAWTVCLFIGRRDGRISLAVPLATKKYGFFKIARGFPLGLYTGLISLPNIGNLEKEDFLEKLIDALKSYSSVSLFFDPFDNFSQQFMLNKINCEKFCSEYAASIVDLSISSEEIRSKYKHGVRKNIRQAIEKGVKINEVTNVEELEQFYELATYIYKFHTKNMPYTFEFYERLFVSNEVKFLLAKVDGAVVGGSIHLSDALQSFNLLTVAYKNYNSFHSNTLLINHEIERAKVSGVHFYNLGASPLGGALISFKNSWGAKNIYYRTYQKNTNLYRLIDRVRHFVLVAMKLFLR